MGHLLWVVLVEEYSHFGKATKLHHLYVNCIIYIISVSTSYPVCVHVTVCVYTCGHEVISCSSAPYVTSNEIFITSSEIFIDFLIRAAS